MRYWGGVKLGEKVALVTGAASGIGRAIACLFGREGAGVSVVDCDATGGRETLDLMQQEGGSALFLPADISLAEDARRIVEMTVSRYGGLDILVNSAGIWQGGSVETLSVEEWDRVMAVNLRGPFLASKYAIPHMRRRGGGCILHLGSANALRPMAGRDAYNASKGALLALTRGMALELARDNIRVNCLCPGTIDTPMIDEVLAQGFPAGGPSRESLIQRQPLARLGRAEEIARAALYVVSEEAAFMTGSVMVLDGGMSL